LAKACQVGGSLGLRASDLAAEIIEHEPSMIDLPGIKKYKQIVNIWKNLARHLKICFTG
jgi:hypothetical protein